MWELLSRTSPFIGSTDNFESARAVVAGAPMDWTTSFRPGTRFGPRSVREVSLVLELYSPYAGKSLNGVTFADIGDVNLPFGNVAGALDRLAQVARSVLERGKFPLFLGGEHLISYPLIKEVAAKHPGLVVLHLDAHADLASEFGGEKFSHATVMRRVLELSDVSTVYQFGIRSLSEDEARFVRESGRGGKVRQNLFDVLEPLSAVLPELGGKPVYLSLDIDVVDPAYAPGTGTPEPGGISARELLAAIARLKGLNLVGADVVEVSPVGDESERTAVLAAKVVRELLVSLVA